MYYYGDFRSLDTSVDSLGQLYKVVIITNYNANHADAYNTPNQTQLTMGANPFVVDYIGDSENVYKPYKLSTATIRICTSKIYEDMYDASGNNVLVLLLKRDNDVVFSFEYGGWYNTRTKQSLQTTTQSTIDAFSYSVEWVGYLTPNSYSQQYDSSINILELNAQDAVSTLQYFKYESESYDMTNVYHVLEKLIAKLGVYKHLYITNSIRQNINTLKDFPLVKDLYIAEQNWFDEDGESAYELDVLSELLKILNLQLTPIGDSIYITQPDAQISVWNTYYHYTNTDDNIYTSSPNFNYKGTLSINNTTHQIEKGDYANSGTSVNIGDIYNKVSVENNNYPSSFFVENIDDLVNKNTINDGIVETSYTEGDVTYREYAWIEYFNTLKKVGYNLNSKYQTYFYSKYDELHTIATPTTHFLYNDYDYVGKTMVNHIGCGVMGYQTSESQDEVVRLENSLAFYTPIVSIVNDEFSLADAKILANQPNNNQLYLFSMTSKNFVLNSKNIIQIDGKFTFFAEQNQLPFKINRIVKDDGGIIELSTHHPVKEMCHNWLSVSIGGKYWWNGSDWVTTESKFKMPLEYQADGSCFNTSINIKANSKKLNIEKGYCITKMPPIDNLYTYIEIRVFRPWGISTIPTHLTLLDDLSVKVLGENGEEKLENKVFTNHLDGKAINEFSKIDTMTATPKSEIPNYATMYRKHGEDDVLTLNKDVDLVGRISNVATSQWSQAEYHIINNIKQQTEKATKRINTTLHYNKEMLFHPYTFSYLNGKYLINNYTIDYETEVINMELLEKKKFDVHTNSLWANTQRAMARNMDVIGKKLVNKNFEEEKFISPLRPTAIELNNNTGYLFIRYE